jgi:hypothetical protein
LVQLEIGLIVDQCPGGPLTLIDLGADLQMSGCASKGILVGNGLCEGPPKGRLGGSVFSPHVLQVARTHSIALVDSIELYVVVCGILRGDITELEPIREKMLGTNGFVDLLPFARNSPFPAT